MSRLRAGLAFTLAVVFAVTACDQELSLAPEGEAAGPTANADVVDGNVAGCQDTGFLTDPTDPGSELTAVVVNQDVVDQTIIVGDCDVGAYFDEGGVVENATFEQGDDDGAPSVQYAVRVDGANVEVTGSEVDVVEDFGPQFIAIGYRNGATGRIADNTITGFHRAGILLDGEGTSATVKGNEVTGVGEKTEGWAENGIQVSRGATGTLNDNEVRDHWWDKDDFVSSGIIIFGSDDVTAQHNTLSGNDAALTLQDGDRNNLIQNTVDVTDDDGDESGIFHAGAIVFSGEDTGLRQTQFTSGSPEGSANFGIFLTGAAVNTKLIRNSFDGDFAQEIVDQGDETKLPDPFDPGS